MARDLTSGSIPLGGLAFGLPLALGSAAHGLFNLIDLKLVGLIDREALAAIHLGSVINFLPMLLANGYTVGVAAHIARHLGAGRRDRAGHLANRALLVLLAAGVGLGLLGWWLADPLVGYMGAVGRARTEGALYLRILSLGTVTMFLLLQVTAALRAVGSAWRPATLLVGANVLNLGLDVVLIFGWERLGIPALGVEGAAWGTVLGRGAGALAGVLLLARTRLPVRLARPRWSGWLREQAALLRIGLPQSLQIMVRVLVIIQVTRIAAALGGNPAVAALSVGVRLDMVLLFCAAGWGSAGGAVVGQNLGAGRGRRAFLGGWTTALLAAGTGLVAGAVYHLWAADLVAFFCARPAGEVVALGVDYFRIIVFGYPLAALAIALAGAVNGAGEATRPMLLDLVGYGLIYLPLVTLLAATWEGTGQLSHLWWTLVGFQVIMGGVYALWYQRRRWLHRALETEASP